LEKTFAYASLRSKDAKFGLESRHRAALGSIARRFLACRDQTSLMLHSHPHTPSLHRATRNFFSFALSDAAQAEASGGGREAYQEGVGVREMAKRE